MPTVAVLPFNGGADRRDVAQGLTREALSLLSTFPGAHTVAVADPAAVRQCGAANTLEGDIQTTGEKTRVVSRQNDVATGESLWVDRYDFEGSDWPAMQENAARRVYGAVGGGFGKIMTNETEKAWRKPDRDLTDFDYYMRAQRFLRADTKEGYAQAQELAEKGLAHFPDSPALNLLVAHAILQKHLNLGPFKNCREQFALAWKYMTSTSKAKRKSKW